MLFLRLLLLGVLSFARVSPAASLAVGAIAPDFNLMGTDGKDHGLKASLAKYEGAVVGFVAVKCPFSNAYNERYNKLVEALGMKPKKLIFLALNSNQTESFEEVKAHADSNKFKFPVLKDEGSRVADAYGAEKTPEVFLVSKEMKILYKGRIDDDSEGKNVKRNDLLVAVDEALAGKKVSVSRTQAFGCSIKRQ